ncbi:hypothetical protein F53441_7320 [Fusarium austroafricanum]|uniref:Uncharacterized protein n=1 Tax=Fusarium austroafricanum TaxID=2364996 RepID=A0A8H4NSC6_9HYPO|nr:hypothetical protein F53441_7320 [Fusarium austroafricanum]
MPLFLLTKLQLLCNSCVNPQHLEDYQMVQQCGWDEKRPTWPDITLNIAFSYLAQLAQDAQKWQKKKESGGSDDTAKPKRVIRKRRLSSSPVEDLRSEDKAYYSKKEAADASRHDASDGDYRPPVAKRRG